MVPKNSAGSSDASRCGGTKRVVFCCCFGHKIFLQKRWRLGFPRQSAGDSCLCPAGLGARWRRAQGLRFSKKHNPSIHALFSFDICVGGRRSGGFCFLPFPRGTGRKHDFPPPLGGLISEWPPCKKNENPPNRVVFSVFGPPNIKNAANVSPPPPPPPPPVPPTFRAQAGPGPGPPRTGRAPRPKPKPEFLCPPPETKKKNFAPFSAFIFLFFFCAASLFPKLTRKKGFPPPPPPPPRPRPEKMPPTKPLLGKKTTAPFFYSCCRSFLSPPRPPGPRSRPGPMGPPLFQGPGRTPSRPPCPPLRTSPRGSPPVPPFGTFPPRKKK